MLRFLASAILVVASAAPAFAVLPPQYQRQREPQAIIESGEVVDPVCD